MQRLLLVSRGGNGNRDLSLAAIYKGVFRLGVWGLGPVEGLVVRWSVHT